MKNVIKITAISILMTIFLSACSLKTSSEDRNLKDDYYSEIKKEFQNTYVLYYEDRKTMKESDYKDKLLFHKVLAGFSPSEMGIEKFDRWEEFATFINYAQPDAAYFGDLIAYLSMDFFNPDEKQTPKLKGYNAMFYYDSNNSKKWQLVKVKKHEFDTEEIVTDVRTAWDNKE